MIFIVIFKLICFSFVNAAEIDLFISDRDKLHEILNTQKHSLALEAFISNTNLTKQYQKNLLPMKSYFFIDLQRKKESIVFTQVDNNVLVNIGKLHCRFPVSTIKLDRNYNQNLSFFVMDSEQCRIKGSYIKDLNKVTTLIIHNKENKKFIVTGSLIEDR